MMEDNIDFETNPPPGYTVKRASVPDSPPRPVYVSSRPTLIFWLFIIIFGYGAVALLSPQLTFDRDAVIMLVILGIVAEIIATVLDLIHLFLIRRKRD